MANKRKIEIFSAGCPVCDRAISTVEDMADDRFDVRVLDMNDPKVAERARNLGVASVPAVFMDGQLLDCCGAQGVTPDSLRDAGIGA